MTIQRLYQAASATVDASGALHLTFFPVPSTLMWTGTINVTNATGNEQWQALVGQSKEGSPWGSFIGSAQFGPIQATGGEVITITGSGLKAGTIYNASLIGTSSGVGEVPYASPQPQPLSLSQIAAVVSGDITALQPQAAMAGSPLTPAGPGATTFTWPTGGPYSSIIVAISNADPTVLTVTGATTGQQYLKETISRGRWTLDVSSIVEPAGVTIAYALTTGWTGTWGITLNVVASTAPLVQRQLYGPGDPGPLAQTAARVTSVPGAGRSSTALIGGNKGNSFRIYSAWITVQQVAAGAQGTAYLTYGVVDFLACAYGAAANANAIAVSIPGGFLLDSNTLGLNPISVQIDNSAGPPSAVGGIFYSEES